MKGLHALVAATAATLTTTALASSPPSTITLDGILRDFKKAHPDFHVTSPADGAGHYAGNVAHTLAASKQPSFSGTGFSVSTQWTNSGLANIAPHLYSAAGVGEVLLVNGPDINNNPTIDTWDSTVGPYGGANVGPAPAFQTGATMPVVTVPTGLPWTDEWKFDHNGTTVFSTSTHCSKFEVTNQHTLQISGDVVIVADDLFKVQNNSAIELLPGASLAIYVLKDWEVSNNGDLNNAPNLGDPSLVQVFYTGSDTIKLSNNVDVYAQIVAPDGELEVANNAEFFGTYTGKDLTIKNSAGFHIDGGVGGGTALMCGTPIADNLGAAGVTSTGDITNAASFDQWYTEELGVSLAADHPITLVRDAMGVYEFIDPTFFPADGRLYGNEMEAHNYNFTYEVAADFVYSDCAGHFIELAGSDDIWLFVNDQLVIDLGGIDAGVNQVIELDRLGLTDGNVYQMHLFHAHRGGAVPALTIRTNVELVARTELVGVTWPND